MQEQSEEEPGKDMTRGRQQGIRKEVSWATVEELMQSLGLVNYQSLLRKYILKPLSQVLI